MKNLFTQFKWNPYAAGACVGLLAVASVLFSTALLGKPQYLGASTTFVRAAGYLESALSAEHVLDNAYFQKTKVKVDWQMMFVFGIFCGALLSSKLGRSFQFETVPGIWRERFGRSPIKRAVGAFAGGCVAIYGARMAGGCPSGHGLSGVMQLALSGLIAMVCFILGGLITAKFLYQERKK